MSGWLENTRDVDVETLDLAYEPGDLLLAVVQELAASIGRQVGASQGYVADGRPRLKITYYQPVKEAS